MTKGFIENARKLIEPGIEVSAPTYFFYVTAPSHYLDSQSHPYQIEFSNGFTYTYDLVNDFEPLDPDDERPFVVSLLTNIIPSIIPVTASQGSASASSIGYAFWDVSVGTPGNYVAGFSTTPEIYDDNDVGIMIPARANDVLSTLAHETLHIYGLKDADNVTAIPSTERTVQFTMMSYLANPSGVSQVQKLQLYDIAALQYMYGAAATRTLNDTYSQFKISGDNDFFSIWDAGGTADKITAGDSTDNVLIDLRPGFFSSLGGTTQVTHSGTTIAYGIQNISIAFGAYIENATGGDDNDVLIGNLFSNELRGDEGDDLIFAEGFGVDGDDGDYSTISQGTITPYTPTATAQIDKLYGEADNDRLVGGRGADILDGGTGNDTLDGGTGSDQLFGGADHDEIYGGTGTTAIAGQAGSDLIIARNGNANGGADADFIRAAFAAGGQAVLGGESYDRFIVGQGEVNGGGSDDFYEGMTGGIIHFGAGGGRDVVETTDNSSGIIDFGALSLSDLSIIWQQTSYELSTSLVDEVEEYVIYSHSYLGRIAIRLAGGETIALGTLSASITDWPEQWNENDQSVITYQCNYILRTVDGDFTIDDLVEELGLVGLPPQAATNTNFNALEKWQANYAGPQIMPTDQSGAAATGGDDILLGNATSRTANYTNASAAVVVDLGNLERQATGGSGSDLLLGIRALVGSAYADTLTGSGNADTLDGGAGADVMTGGAGDDVYIVSVSSDQTIEAVAGGTDTVRSAVNLTLGSNMENLILLGSAVTGNGNTADNQITGNDANNNLQGYEGDDTLIGGNGDDTLGGSTGNDSLEGGAGNDRYYVDAVGDIVNENGGAGLTGGNDTAHVQVNNYTLGTDIEILRMESSDNLQAWGNELNNRMIGNVGANLVYGLGGDDSLEGGDGADTLVGGEGSDTLVGGAHADVFRFETSNSGVDRILDFSQTEDRFDLGGGSFTALSTAANGDAVLTHSGGAVRVASPPSLTLSQWNALVLPGGGMSLALEETGGAAIPGVVLLAGDFLSALHPRAAFLPEWLAA